MGLAALSTESVPGKRIASDHVIVKNLAHAVAEFISRLGRDELSGEVAERMAKLLRAEQHLLACSVQALEIARVQGGLSPLGDNQLMEHIADYRAKVVHLMTLANPEADDFSFVSCDMQLEQVQLAYDEVKAELLLAGAGLRTSIPGVIEILEQNSRIRRMARQMVKAMRNLSEMYSVTDAGVPEDDETAIAHDSE
jgi:phosphate:Na+ symporter